MVVRCLSQLSIDMAPWGLDRSPVVALQGLHGNQENITKTNRGPQVHHYPKSKEVERPKAPQEYYVSRGATICCEKNGLHVYDFWPNPSYRESLKAIHVLSRMPAQFLFSPKGHLTHPLGRSLVYRTSKNLEKKEIALKAPYLGSQGLAQELSLWNFTLRVVACGFLIFQIEIFGMGSQLGNSNYFIWNFSFATGDLSSITLA